MVKHEKKLSVLVVDDMKTIRDVIVSGIRRTFFNVTVDEAEDGRTAQLKLQKSRYDMIISDWEMPKVKGGELLQWVRNQPELKDTPFIMLTANSAKESVIESMHLGVNAYMIKPFTIESLTMKMTGLIDKFDRRECERFVTNSPVTLLAKGKKSVSGNLLDISAGGLFGIFPRKAVLPGIMEEVTVDIFYKAREGKPKTVSVDGFVIRLQAAEVVKDTDHIKIAIKFNDDCVSKNDALSGYLNHLK